MPTWLDKIVNSQFVMIGLAGLAFLIALWLVIVIVRMLTGGRLRTSGNRTRQARLGIVDAFDLDRQRQLIIVRRDNTEHLIMIGGPNDLVIESEIVRVEARDSRRGIDKGEALVDNRIPAPTMTPDAASPLAGEEPLLPMAMPPQPVPERAGEPMLVPEPVRAEPSFPEPVRAPSFPLPPRRPAPLPERRPPPPPESVSRADERLPVPVSPPPVPVAAPPAEAPVVTPPPPPSVAAPDAEAGTEGIPPRPPVLRTPPSFLKPLPPRPPIRPLRRATPVASGSAPAPVPSAGAPPAAADAQSVAETLPPAPAPAPPAEPQAPPVEPATAPAPVTAPRPHAAEEVNPLESLEEEMAKLLGRQ